MVRPKDEFGRCIEVVEIEQVPCAVVMPRGAASEVLSLPGEHDDDGFPRPCFPALIM